MNLEEKLLLIKDIKHFCVEELGIKNDSFTRTVKQKAVHVLYASPKYSIESAIQGRFNLVYKNLKERSEDAAKWGSKLDIHIMDWEASSNNHQITSSMLKATNTRLIYLIIHENVHIYLRDKGIRVNKGLSLDIEEAIADTIAYKGALEFYNDNKLMQYNIREDKKKYDDYNLENNNYIKILKKKYAENPLSGRKKLYQIRAKTKNPNINNAYLYYNSFYSKNDYEIQKMLLDIHPRIILEKIKDSKDITSMKKFKTLMKQ